MTNFTAAIAGIAVGAGATGAVVGAGATGAVVGAGAGALVGVAAGWQAANSRPTTANKLTIEKRIFIFLLLQEYIEIGVLARYFLDEQASFELTD
jgi:hypothetical protein